MISTRGGAFLSTNVLGDKLLVTKHKDVVLLSSHRPIPFGDKTTDFLTSIPLK